MKDRDFIRERAWLKVKRRVDLEYDNHEFIWLQLDFSNKSVLICIVYRTQGAINPSRNRLSCISKPNVDKIYVSHLGFLI
jgi:hypothetical protein